MTRYSRGQRKSRHTFLLPIPKLGTRTGDMYERVCGRADSIHTAIILLLAAPRAINPRGNFLHFPVHPAYVRRIPSVAPELRDFRKRSRAQGIIFSGRRSSVFQSPRRGGIERILGTRIPKQPSGGPRSTSRGNGECRRERLRSFSSLNRFRASRFGRFREQFGERNR